MFEVNLGHETVSQKGRGGVQNTEGEGQAGQGTLESVGLSWWVMGPQRVSRQDRKQTVSSWPPTLGEAFALGPVAKPVWNLFGL